MSLVEVAIEIGAPPQTVFDTVMDASRLADWVTIHRDVTVRGDGRPVRGATMDQVLCIRGVSFTVHWTLAAVSAPNSADWQGRGPAGSRARTSYKMTGPAEGPTHFAYANEFTTPGGVLGKAASRLVVGSVPKREAEQSLQRLKALLEQRGT